MSIWIVMIVLGLLTFAIRFSFISMLEHINMPRNFIRALRFVPIAVLSAIIAPELAYYNNALAISLTNPRLLAGILATIVAFKTKSVIWTISAGMAAFWLLRLWL
ncbi:MAG TPA: AzlD domain-containing protein [Anaerolineales bacterium]